MSFKRIILAMFAVLLAVTLSSREGHAFNLGLPDINFDTFSGGSLNYNASTKNLSVNATLVAVTSPGSVTTYPGGTVSYTMNLSSVSSSGGVTTGYFGTSSLANDLVIIDGSNNLLLSGEFISADVTGIDGTNYGWGSAIFQVTGGSLGSAFTAPCSSLNCGGMVNLAFNLSRNFSQSMFNSNFNGHTSGDIAPVAVPEPSTLLLLGSGLVGAGFLIRRKK